MKKQIAQFRFLDFKILKSIYQIDVNKFGKHNELDVNFKFASDIQMSNDGKLIFPMEVIIEDNNKSLRIQVESTGIFESDVDLTQIKSFTEVNAPAIMFPYLRAYVSSITSLSGIRPILLPTYNMAQNRSQDKKSETD